MGDNEKGGRYERNDKEFGGRGNRRSRGRKRVCSFCVDKVDSVNYKEVAKLRKYVSERGKILPRRISGNCAKHQRCLTDAIKKARIVALLPYTSD